MSQISASLTKVRNIGGGVRGRGTSSFSEGRIESVQCRQAAYCLLRLSPTRLCDVTNDYEFFPRGRVRGFFTGMFRGCKWEGAEFCVTNLDG